MNTDQNYDFAGGAAAPAPADAMGGVGGAAWSSQAQVTPEVVPPPIDFNAIMLQGLKTLPEEERARLLADLVSHQLNNKQSDLDKQKAQFEFDKNKRFANLKLYAGIAGFSLVTVFILLFGGVFAYLVLTKGVLNDGSVLTSLFGTMVETLRVILSTSSSY